jgi:hypothetical protein
MQFPKHPHLHPTEITPPPGHRVLRLIKRIKRDGLLVLYSAVYGALLLLVVLYGLHLATMN